VPGSIAPPSSISPPPASHALPPVSLAMPPSHMPASMTLPLPTPRTERPPTRPSDRPMSFDPSEKAPKVTGFPQAPIIVPAAPKPPSVTTTPDPEESPRTRRSPIVSGDDD
jgi:hypothetical protein